MTDILNFTLLGVLINLSKFSLTFVVSTGFGTNATSSSVGKGPLKITL